MFLSEPARTNYDINFDLFGFNVRTHPAFFIMPVLLGRGLIIEGVNTGIGMLILVAVFYVSILVHELGHALAFRRYGIHSRIVLYWMGGLAIPESRHDSWSQQRSGEMTSNQKIIVSLAGPVFGLLLAAAMVGLVYLLGGGVVINRLNLIPFPEANLSNTIFSASRPMAMIFWCGIIINIFLNLFNLVPIYPLDGGQIAREVMVQIDSLNGLKNSIIVSIATAAVIAVLSLSYENHFMMFFFGFMAWSNFQSLQQYGNRPW